MDAAALVRRTANTARSHRAVGEYKTNKEEYVFYTKGIFYLFLHFTKVYLQPNWKQFAATHELFLSNLKVRTYLANALQRALLYIGISRKACSEKVLDLHQ